MMRCVALMVAAALVFAAGCGSDAEEADAPPTGPAVERSSEHATDSADPPAAAGGGQTPDEPGGAGAGRESDEGGGGEDRAGDHGAEADPRREPAEASAFAPLASDAGFAEHLARIRRLEERAEFERALQLCQRLRSRDLTGPQDKQLAAVMSRLSRYRSAAPSLRYAIEKLGADSSWAAREAARRKLLDAGDLGRLLLQQLVREAQGAPLESALELLERQHAWAALPSMIERVIDQPGSDASQQVMTTIEGMVEDVPADRRGELGGEFARLFGLLQADSDFRRRRVADLFVTIARDWMERDYAKLNDYLGIAEAAVYLESYFRVAAASDRDELRRFGLKRLLAFGSETPGLVGWWAFEALADGRVTDLTGRGRHGRVRGATAVPGKYGSALRFDGEDDLIRIPDASAFSGGRGASRTVSVVFKTDQPDGYQPIVEKQWDGGHGDWGLSVGNGQLVYYSEAHIADYRVRGGEVPSDQWVHAVMTLRQTGDRFEVRLYLDGERVASGTEQGHVSADTDGDVFIGARRYNNRQNEGQGRAVIDDVRIYDRRLGDAEVRQLNPGAYLWSRGLGGGPDAAAALVEAIEQEPPAGRQRILLTALRRVCRDVPAGERSAYRAALRRLLDLAEAQGGGDERPERWDRTIDALAGAWFDGDAAALRNWLHADGADGA